MDRSTQIDTLSSITQVSRETIASLNKYEKILIEANKTLNLIGKSTINKIWIRHFLDSLQVIDFIDKNDGSIVDLGSGAGFPGLILAIGAKDKKLSFKIKLIEKSPKKAKFLREIIQQLNLDAQIINQNVFQMRNKFYDDVFVARAFKPLNKILELIHSNAKNWKKILVFLGKTGKSELIEASKIWDIEYKQKKSVTNDDSLIIMLTKINKK